MKEKKISIKKSIIIIILLLTTIILWARFINTKGLNIKEYGIVNKNLPSSFHGLKIVHFSDIQYGQTTNLKDIKKTIKKINSLKPDIVIFTGDLFNKNINPSKKELKDITKELNKINVNLYKYAIIGDADKQNYNDYKNVMENSEFISLNNSNELLYYKGNIPIKIVGITNLKDLETTFKEEALEPSFTIALFHKPDYIDKLNEYRIDLAFSGHSLGGQLKAPFFDGLIKKDGAEKYINDYYKVNKTDFYISNGLGTENIKFRTFNKPAINLYRIYAK